MIFTEPPANARAAADAQQHARRSNRPIRARRAGGKEIKQDCHRQRSQGPARGPLDYPCEHELDGTSRKCVQHEPEREDDD